MFNCASEMWASEWQPDFFYYQIQTVYCYNITAVRIHYCKCCTNRQQHEETFSFLISWNIIVMLPFSRNFDKRCVPRLSYCFVLPATGNDRPLKTAADVIKMATNHVTYTMLYNDVIKRRKVTIQSAKCWYSGCTFTHKIMAAGILVPRVFFELMSHWC